MIETNITTLHRFEQNYDAVSRLMEFDNLILTFAKGALESVQKKVKTYNPNPLLTKEIDNALKGINQIHEHESLRHQYERINNQCLVLLVSYFALAVESIFKDSLVAALQRLPSDALKAEPIKVSIDDLRRTEFDLSTSIGDLIARDISFQDMQSIARAFQSYYTIKVVVDKDVNNIILAQACRHVIVHSGGIVNQRLQNQTSGAQPRDVKTNLVMETELGFEREDVQVIGTSMKTYLNNLVLKIEEVLSD